MAMKDCTFVEDGRNLVADLATRVRRSARERACGYWAALRAAINEYHGAGQGVNVGCCFAALQEGAGREDLRWFSCVLGEVVVSRLLSIIAV